MKSKIYVNPLYCATATFLLFAERNFVQILIQMYNKYALGDFKIIRAHIILSDETDLHLDAWKETIGI